METYLQHLKFLRGHMNDHEDKVAWLSAEQSEQKSHIRHLQKDLESVRADGNRAKDEVEAFSKEAANVSKLILSHQKTIGALDSDSRTLSLAWELMNENMSKKSTRLLESKSLYEKLEADARSKLDRYQAQYGSLKGENKEAQYESLKRETEESDASLAKAAEKAPVKLRQQMLVEEKNDHGEITEDFKMVEAGNDVVGSKIRLRQLQEEAQQAEEDLKRVDIENDQLEAGFRLSEESLRELNEEKLAEEDFMQTLHNRLQQLKDYSEDVVCGSCKHVYVIEWDDSEFVIRSA